MVEVPGMKHWGAASPVWKGSLFSYSSMLCPREPMVNNHLFYEKEVYQ